MIDNDKVICLSFVEIYISLDMCFDKVSQVIGPHITVQVMMARGIFKL